MSALGFIGFSMAQGLWFAWGVWSVETDMYIAVQPNLQEFVFFIKLTLLLVVSGVVLRIDDCK